MRPARALVLAVGALLVGGCSATKLAYNNLDSLVSWQVGKFVDLSGPSEELFDAGFRSLWAWHRRSELPRYVADLRELARAIDAPMSVTQVEQQLQRMQDHVDRTVAQGLPDGARVLAALDDEQVAGLLRRMDERRAERAREAGKLTPAEAREKARKRLEQGLRRWIGRLTPEQQARIAGWASGVRVDPEAQAAASRAWGAAFAALLRDRAAPDFEPRLLALLEYRDFDGHEAAREVYEHNRAAGIALLADLSGTLTVQQRNHFRDELEDLALDLEQLAAAAPP